MHPTDDTVGVTLWNGNIVAITRTGQIYVWRQVRYQWQWQAEAYLPERR